MNFSHGKLITILQYFSRRFQDYWHILYPDVSFEERESDQFLYFYDISKKATDYKGSFDDSGIYLFKGYDGFDHIHALELSQYSLACWLAWRKTNTKYYLDKALLHCEWLVNNQMKNGSWVIEHKNPSYSDLPSPWPSGMAQGLAISALVRAYKYTKNIKYLDVACKACDFLELGVANGGVKRDFIINGIEGYIYEEYPRSKLNGVLNGYITSILGVYELSIINSKYTAVFNENMKNLNTILPLYDTGYWSYYSLDGNIDSGFYHRYIIIQLTAIESIDSSVSEVKDRFIYYRDSKVSQIKALFNKVKYKL
ncbi:MAG: D-glucuronyl C5-epimerase family protein [Pseudomonadales bacterium]|nr:D-glucuronyl C5-epimerase family protein [Pseudomonadales bacterium]